MSITRLYKLTLIPLLILTGCAGLSDFSVDLPGNYSIVRTSAHYVTIAPKVGDNMWGENVIRTKVTEVAWDKKYIIAKQLDLKPDPESNNGYQIPDEQSYHYWILEIKSGEVTGPLDEANLEVKKAEFQISEDVVLKKIEDIKQDTSSTN